MKYLWSTAPPSLSAMVRKVLQKVISIAWELVSALFIGAIGWAALFGLYIYWTPIVESLISLKSLAIVLPVLGVTAALLFYLLRSMARVQYGIAEILFGIAAMISASDSAKLRESIPTVVLQVAAGIYIVVRGLDNIKIGLQNDDHPLIRAFWRLIFGHDELRMFRRLRALKRKRRLDTYRRMKRLSRSWMAPSFSRPLGKN
jgi:hypothetical protein